jgi:hypothetical protein
MINPGVFVLCLVENWLVDASFYIEKKEVEKWRKALYQKWCKDFKEPDQCLAKNGSTRK